MRLLHEGDNIWGIMLSSVIFFFEQYAFFCLVYGIGKAPDAHGSGCLGTRLLNWRANGTN